jgi:DNA polymerase-3 subunit epsilon
MARAIYYDTETTGIKADRDRIIELAAYDPVRDLKFERFINPGIIIPDEAIAIHHITNEMVASAPSFDVVGAEFIEFCEGDVILIAHNNDNFDYHFLRHEFGRHKLTMPSWKFLDTLKWARRYRPDLPRHTLQFLREIYGIMANNAHRAFDDVDVLYKVFKIMIDDLSIDEVYALLNRPRDLQHMPFGKHQGQPLSQIPRNYVQWLSTSGAFDKAENQDLKEMFSKLGLLEPVGA